MTPLYPVDFRFDAPMQVTDMPISLEGDPRRRHMLQVIRQNPGLAHNIGFLKKLWKRAKKFTKKTARFITRNPVSNLARRYTPKFIKRQLRGAWRHAKKIAKYATYPIRLVLKTAYKITGAIVKAIIRRIIGRGVKKVARRRANFIAFRRRGSKRPNQRERSEGIRWARKYVKSKGWLGKLFGGTMKKVTRDKRVIRAVAQKQRRSRMTGERFEVGGPVTATITAIAIPVLISLVNKLVGQAESEGAPADPRQAAPEQTLQNQLAEQAGRAALEYFPPPSYTQAAYRAPPEPEPRQRAPEYYMPPETDIPAYGPPPEPGELMDPFAPYEEF